MKLSDFKAILEQLNRIEDKLDRRIANHEARIGDLEHAKAYSKGALAIIIGVLGAVGGLAVIALKSFFKL